MGTARALSAVSFREGRVDRSYVECELGDSEAAALGCPEVPVAKGFVADFNHFTFEEWRN